MYTLYIFIELFASHSTTLSLRIRKEKMNDKYLVVLKRHEIVLKTAAKKRKEKKKSNKAYAI